MKVILTQTVAGLGDAGTVKEVADGYARNFLLPKKLAVAATRGSLKQAELQSHVYTRRANKVLTEAQQGAAALEGKTITVRARVGSENRLYGSVTAADIATALQSQYNITIDRRRIELDEAIHRTGTYGASADFGQGVAAKFTVEVAPEVAGAHGKATVVGAEPAPAPAAAAAAVATLPEPAETGEADEAGEAPVEEQAE